MEIYLTNTQEHSAPAIQIFKDYVGQHRPAGSPIGVTDLTFPEQLIEISAVAHSNKSWEMQHQKTYIYI